MYLKHGARFEVKIPEGEHHGTYIGVMKFEYSEVYIELRDQREKLVTSFRLIYLVDNLHARVRPLPQEDQDPSNEDFNPKLQVIDKDVTNFFEVSNA